MSFSKSFFAASALGLSLAPLNAQSLPSTALPTGGNILSGQGSIHQQGSGMVIDQNSQRLITEWNAFDIGSSASVRFNQPGADAIALNRVTGHNTSQILGSLEANGRVFLINPNGLYFGANASVNVGGLVASSLALSDADFLAGRYHFQSAGNPGAIVNDGTLSASSGGIVAFIAPRISNNGTLSAESGTVALAAGDKVTLDFSGDGLINLSVDAASIDAQVANRGLVRADGGLVLMTARAAGDLTGSVVNNTGIVEADTLVSRDGRIILDGGDLGIVENSGDLLATGSSDGLSGGHIVLTGEKVGIFGDASLDASGHAGGGTISIGGGFQGADSSIANASRTFVSSDATIRADALAHGDGGQVIVWSDDITRFQGSASARGGSQSGDGGFIEISGKGLLEMTGLVDAGSHHGLGGTVLFDPKNIIVHDSGSAALTDVDAFADNASGTSTIAPNTITAATNAGTAVVLQANNDITINSSIFTVNAGGTGGSLSFRAGRGIAINSNIYSDDGDVSFTLNDSGADGAQRDAGTATFVNNSLVDAGSGTVSITMGTESDSAGISTGQITAQNFNITHNGPTAGAVTGQIDLGEITVTGNLGITTSTTRNIVNTVGNVSVLGTTTIDAKGGDVTLTRATTDLNIGAFTDVGNVTLNDANSFRFGNGTIAGSLTVTTKGPIASTGAITVTGLATLTANNGGFGYADPYINLSNNNDFQGGLALNVATTGETGTGGYATVKDVNGVNITSATLATDFTLTGGGAVNLGATSVGRNLTLTTTGAITDSGTVTVSNYAQFSAGAANDITLDSAANNFNYLRIGSGRDVIVNDTNALTFGYLTSSVSTVSGNLSVTAGGNISQYGYGDWGVPYDSRLLVTGNSLFTVTAASSNLFLGYVDPLSSTNTGLANNLAGTVTIAKSGAGSYQDVYLRNISSNTAQIVGLATVGTLRDVSLRYDNATSVEIPGMTLSRNLSVSAPSGGITQSGALVVPGIAMFRASGSSDIVLNNASNNFYRVTVNGARDVSLTDLNAIELYGNNYQFSLSRHLNVTAGGAITDASTADWAHYISVPGGTATFNAGASNNITLDNAYNQFSRVDIAGGNNVSIYDNDSIVFGNSAISGTFLVDSLYGGTLTQVASTAISSGAATFNNFISGITLNEASNVFGAIALSSDTGAVNIRENDAITQASAWNLSTYRPSVTLTTSDDQAITLTNASNRFGNVTITQINNGNLAPGAVSITENDYDATPSNSGITQGSAWTTHGATTLNSGAYSITLTNANNILGPLQVIGASSANQNIAISAKETPGKAAIYDAGSLGAWSTGTAATNLVSLVGYDSTGTTAGAGDIFLTQAGNVLGDLYVRGNDVTLTDSTTLTDGATAWITTGTTTLNAGSSSINLDNLTNSLGPIAIGGTPSSVLITDNTDLTQASAWLVGSAPVTLDARNHHIDLSTSGNVLGAVRITTANGVPLSVKLTEDDAITQGDVWSLNGVGVTLVAENDKTITLTNASNILGNLTVTGGAVSITENDAITQGGAWTTTGTTTLNAGTNIITLNNTANVLGALAFTGNTSSISIVENSDITQASAWNLTSTPITLNSQSHDILLTQAANQLGDLTLSGQNVSVTENHLISDGSAWTVPGLTTLTAGSNAIVLDANPKSDFGTVRIVSASSADLNDINGLIFDTSSVTGTLTATAGGHITQTGAITANSLLLAGTGYATLNNAANNVVNLAAGFTGGDLAYTDADNVAVSVINVTTGVNIGANDVSLTSIAGTITGLTSVNPVSSSLTVNTGAPLTLPQMTIAGAQNYTATGGITLNANVTSTAAGAITFHSPVTLTSDLSVQSTNSNITFHGTIAGGGNSLVVNAGSGLATFSQNVSALGATSDANAALQLTSGGAVFHGTLGANNGLTVSGPVTFLDSVTLANGNAATVFAGLVTLGKIGGMSLSGYDGMTFNGGVVLQNGASTINSNNSALVFQGANTISGPFGLTLDSGTAQITGLDHVGTNLTSLSVTSSSPVIPSGGISIAGPQSYTATGGTSITLNGNVTSTAAGSILFNSPVSVGATATVTSVDSAITFASTVDGAHDLTVASGTGLKTFSGRIGNSTPLGDGTGYALTLTGSGAASFAETVSTASGLSIAGPATFSKDVTLGNGSVGSMFSGPVTAGGLTLSGFDGLTFADTLTLSGTLTLNSQGGSLNFNNTVGGAHALTLTLGSGSVSGLGQLSSALTGFTLNNSNVVTLPALTISGPQTYNGPVTISGNLTGTALTFNQPATLGANNLTLDAATGTIAFNNTFALGAHNLVLNADEIDFAAALTGTGNLTLRPATVGANIVLGGATSTAALDLTAADLAWLPSTFASLVIGRNDGTGTLAIAGASDFGATALTLHGGGGISQTAALTSGALTLRTAGTGINLSNTSNSLGAITLLGTPSSVNIADSTDITQGAAWTLGNAGVTFNSGSHDIFLTQAANTFGTVAVTGRDVQIVENAGTDLGASSVASLSVNSAGALYVVGALNATGDVTLTSANYITQTAPFTIGGNLSLTTLSGGGNVFLNNSGASATVLGNNLVGGNYELTSSGDLVSQANATNLQVAGNLTIVSTSAILDGTANLVQGTTTLPGVNTVLRQSGVITLGNINEAGNYTVISEAANRSFDAGPVAGTAMFLNNAANNVAGRISVQTVAPNITTGPDVQTGIVQSAGTSITVAGLASFTASESSAGTLGIQLTNTGNHFGAIKLTGSDIAIRNDAAGLTTLDSVIATSGFRLTTAGAVAQNGSVVTPALGISAAGDVTLNHAANNAAPLAIDANGAIVFNDISGFAIGTVGSLAGIDAHNYDVSLTTQGNNDLTQSASLRNVSTLSLSSQGAIVLDDSSNTIVSLGAVSAQTGLSLRDSDGLSLTAAVQTATGDIALRTSGDLTLQSGSSVTAATGDIALSTEGVGNFINQAGASALTAGSGKRWLVYSKTPDLVGTVHTEKGGLTSSFRRYGSTFSTLAPGSVINSGNGFIYADAAATTLTISPTIVGSASHVYGDTPTGTLGYTVSAGFVDSEDTTNNIGITGTALYSGALSNSMNAGNYSFTYTGGLTSSYTLVADTAGVGYTVTTAPLTYVANTATRSYGDANPSLNGTVTGFKLGQDASVLGGSALWSTIATATDNVGQYAINGAGYTSSNYHFVQAAGNSTALTIAPRTITVTAADQSRIYGNANPNSGTFTIGGLGLVNGDSLTSTVSVSSTATASSNVGSYALTPSSATFSTGSASNYAITYADGVLSVTPRTITVTAADQSRIYGNANPNSGTFTIGGLGLVNGDSLDATVSVSSTATASSNVGTYALTPSSATFSTGSASNYAITYADGALAITPRAITLTPDTQSRIYGDANPTTGAFTVGGLGLVNSDSLSAFIAVTTPATLLSGVGNYALNGSGAAFTSGSASNYDVTYSPGTLAITPATLTYVASNNTRIYGDANPSFSGSVTGFRNTDTLGSATTGTLFFSSPATAASNVGTYAIDGSGLSAANYVFVQAPANASALAITPRPITVAALDHARIYGDANPATFAANAINLVNGDTLGGVTVSTLATAASNVGTYTITPNGAVFSSGSSSNYSITYTAGTLSITPRPLTVTALDQSRIYGDANPTFGNVIADNLVNGDALGASLVSTIATTASGVGSYALTPGAAAFTQGSASNYTITYAPGTLSITPRAITVTALDQSRVYGSDNPTSGGYVLTGGLVNGDALASTVSVSSIATAASNVGAYNLTPASIGFTQGSAANYAVTYVNGALSITPATLTYTATPTVRNAGENNPAFGGTVTGFVNNDTLASSTTGTLVWTSPATISSAPGAYAIDGSGLSANNYLFVQDAANNFALTILEPIPELLLEVTELADQQRASERFAFERPAQSTRLPEVTSSIELIAGGVAPWPPTELFGLTDTDTATSAFVVSGNKLTLSLPDNSPAATGLVIYEYKNGTSSPAGSFTVNDTGSALTIAPDGGQIAPFPSTLDLTGAPVTVAVTLDESTGPVRITLQLATDGILIVDAPASLVEKHGTQGAALAALAAARREFGILPGAIKAVRLSTY